MRARAIILAARHARALHDIRALMKQRAQGKPGADRTRGPRATRSTGVGPQVNRSNAGFPCAMVYGLLRALPGDRAFLATFTGAMRQHRRQLERQHRGARTTRLRRPRVQAFVSRHDPRPPHPAATFVTCATPLLIGRDARIDITDLPDDGSGIFLREGMDRVLMIWPPGRCAAAVAAGFCL